MDAASYQTLLAYNREMKTLDDLYRTAARRCGLGECAFWVLYTLRFEKTAFTQADICEFLVEPKQTVNSALKKLVSAGLLTLRTGTDLRSKQILVTEEGDKFCKVHVDPVLEAEAGSLLAMGEEDRAAILRLTKRYRTLFEARLCGGENLTKELPADFCGI